MNKMEAGSSQSFDARFNLSDSLDEPTAPCTTDDSSSSEENAFHYAFARMTNSVAANKHKDSAVAVKRLLAEKADLLSNPVPFVYAQDKGESLFEWLAVIEGPSGTVYEGSTFFMDMLFSTHYPFVPPQLVFLTRIYHCNINSQGQINLTCFGQWSPSYGIRDVLTAVVKQLCDCDPERPMVEHIARQYQTNRKLHDSIAREWMLRFAQ